MSTIRRVYFLIIIGILFSSSTSAPLTKSSRFSNDQIGSIEKGKLDDNNSSNPSAFDLFKDDSNNQDERRRVTKTVFIAPGLPECPPGYREDEKQRCNKELIINEAAYFGFLSERLSNLFPSDNKSAPSNPVVPSDPFKLNIPLVIDEINNNTSNKINDMEISTSTISTTVIDELENQTIKIMDKNSSIIVNKTDDTPMTSEKEINDRKQFFLGPVVVTEFSAENDKSTSELPVPVVDIVDDTNNFSYSDLVNYKIPELDDNNNNKNTDNTSIDSSPGIEFIEAGKNEFMDSQKNNKSTVSVDLSSTLEPTTLDLLKLSSTTFSPLEEEKEDIVKSLTEITFDRETMTSESLTESTTENSVKVSLNIPDNAGDNLFDSSSIPANIEEKEKEKEKEEKEEEKEEEGGEEEIKHVTENNPEDNVEKVVVVVDDDNDNEPDDSTEKYELLMPSETGISVTITPGRVKQLSTPTQVDSTDTTGSTISSEVTISYDFAHKTTLLNSNNNNNKVIPINTKNKILVLQNDENNKFNTNHQEVTLLPVDTTSTSTININNNNNNNEKRDGEFKTTEIPNVDINKQILFPSTSQIINPELTKNVENISDLKIDESALVKIFDEFFLPAISKKPDNFSFPTTPTTSTTTTDKAINFETIQAASSTEIILQDDKKNDESINDDDDDDKKKKIINSSDLKTLDNQKIEIKYLTTTPATSNINEQYDVDNNRASVINFNKPDDKIRQQYKFSDIDNKSDIKNWRTSESSPSYVTFPNYEKSQQNRIKFPTNSIMSQDDFKEHNQYRVHPPLPPPPPQSSSLSSSHSPSTFIDNSNNGNSKKKKPSNWPWRRTNRQRLFSKESSGGNEKLSKLLQFWAQIPLEKNLNSAYPTVSAADRFSAKSKDSRRFNLYEGISPRDKTRSFAISSSN